jgi:sigma-B regulation protein RsbU (phosphoserine phosphatase)
VREHLHVVDRAIQQASGGNLGLCKICNEPVDEILLDMDYTAEVCLSHLSPDQARSLERELEMSRVVQRSLLPQEAPNIPGLELAAFIRPAQFVAGDFFDFVRFRDGRYGIVVADVSGKGISASLIMASLQTALRALVPEVDSPAGALDRINRLYVHNLHFNAFVTLFLGAYDPAGQTLTYASAGHNPPMLSRSLTTREEQAIYYLQPTGPAIGLMEAPPFQEVTVQLESGDTLLFYTDGVPEAFGAGGEQFGMERLEALLRRNPGLAPSGLLRALQNALSEFMDAHPQEDDITMIAGRVNGEA